MRAASRLTTIPTQPCASGPDLQLIAALGLGTDTQRVPQHHLGSHGGFRLLSLAAQIARGNPTVRSANPRPLLLLNCLEPAFPIHPSYSPSDTLWRSSLPQARILVVYGDIWSLAGNYLPSTLSEADVCSLALYGDGAAGEPPSAATPSPACLTAQAIGTACVFR